MEPKVNSSKHFPKSVYYIRFSWNLTWWQAFKKWFTVNILEFYKKLLLCLKGVNGTHLGPGLTECSEIVKSGWKRLIWIFKEKYSIPFISETEWRGHFWAKINFWEFSLNLNWLIRFFLKLYVMTGIKSISTGRSTVTRRWYLLNQR